MFLSLAHVVSWVRCVRKPICDIVFCVMSFLFRCFDFLLSYFEFLVYVLIVSIPDFYRLFVF